MTQQADGSYPRLNVSTVFSKQHAGTASIVSLVGKIISFDGSSITLESGEGGKIQINIDPDFQSKPGDIIEAIGSNENQTFQVIFNL